MYIFVIGTSSYPGIS